MHAVGVVISQKDVSEYVPLLPGHSDGSIVTQFTMTTLEELGLRKMDFWSPDTDSYPECSKMVEKTRVLFWICRKIDYNDKKYWIPLEPDVLTVFQLE